MNGVGRAILEYKALAAELGKSRQVNGDGRAILKYRALAVELGKSRQVK